MKQLKIILKVSAILGIIGIVAWPPVVLSQSPESTPVDRGKNLYAGHCASCHGMTGDGSGPDATGMTPPPTRIRGGGINGLTDNDLEQAILAGKPNTEMRGYGTILRGPEISDMIAYLRSLSALP